MYKKMALATFFLTAGCGLVNNLKMIGRDLSNAVTTHPYKVTDEDKDKVLASGKGIVDLFFEPYAETTWKKIDTQGNISEETFTLTYFDGASKGRRMSQLEPGTYFLNGIRFNQGNTHCRSGTSGNVLEDKVYGWDTETKKAKCFSFTLKPGEYLVIPNVEADCSGDFSSTDHICPKLSFTHPDNEKSKSYAIGPLGK